MKVRIFIYFFAATFLFGAEKASAQIVFTWKGGTSGSWNSAANWTVGGLPTLLYPGSLSPIITNDVALVNTSNATISYTGNQTIGVLESTNYGVSGLTINFTGTTPVLTIASGLNMAQPSSFTSVIAFTGAGTAVIGGTSSFQYAGSMSIAAATTVTFAASATLDFTANQGTLTNNGTLNFKSGSSIILGSGSALVSPGTVIGTSANFNISGTPAYISYGGKFVSNSCTFSIPSGGYLKSTSTSSAFTAYTSTFNLTGSGGAAYIYNNGTFRDHGSTYNFSGQGVYIQNVALSNMHLSGTTVNFSTSAGNNNQNITNAGTFTADSTSAINLQSYTSYVTNSGIFYAGTSGSSCILNITGQAGTITNTTKGTFYLGSTSIIYPNSYQATIKNTSPGVFTLQSDANGTANIGALTPTAACSGTFNAERFFQGSATYDNVKKRWKARNYRIISPPVSDTSATGLWGLNYIVGATAGQTTVANSASNAFITGCQGGSTTAGNPSTYLYQESYVPSNTTFTSGNFLGITNIANSTSVGFIAASDGSSHSLPVG
jgi:trimeric autotransporter adhesin